MANTEKKPKGWEMPDAIGMMAPGPEAIQAWQAMMAEWGRFITDRLHQDVETQREILACRSAADLVRIQTDFFQKAVQQYSEQATRLTEMAVEASNRTATRKPSARKYDDIPL